jgi:parallel beta-helix repeat protein
VSCGEVITTNTKLHADLVDCPGDGVVIGADNITLDLGGHTIDGLGSGAPFGSDGIDNSGGFEDVVIKNGTVTEFQQGVTLVGTTANVARNLTVAGNGSFLLDVANGNDLARNVIVANALTGILIANSSTNDVVGNRIAQNGGGGLWIASDFPLVSGDNVLARNDLTANATDGILVDLGTTGTVVLANDADGNAEDGIDIRNAATTIMRNRADGNVDLGIDAVLGVLDGGGNRAAGNGNPLQCANVLCS